MRPLPLVLLLRLLLLVAVFASAALVIEYMNAGDPAFCGVGSGCFAVRVSAYSRIFGIPMPYFGLVAFSVLLAGSLIARAREHHRLLAAAVCLGALAAVALIVIQGALIGAFCVWCVTVDSAAIAAAPLAVLLAIQAKKAPPAPELPESGPPPAITEPFWRATIATAPETLIWAAAAALALGLPFVWSRYPVIPPTPPGIAALAAPNKVTIVGFTDFQCPFCRKLHPAIHQFETTYGDRVHYERRMYPLAGHSGALPAAQAYLCAPESKREAAADWLYSTPEETLTRTGVLGLAPVIGLPPAELTKCMASPEVQTAIAADKEIYETTGARGLPLTYVGSRMVIGFNPERVESAIQAELQGSRLALKVSWLFALMGVVIGGAALLTWRMKTANGAASAS